MFRNLIVLLTLCLSVASIGMAQVQQTKGNYVDKFRQMDEIWPTANSYRTAGGEPGHEYWQQRADYKINATLDEKKHRIDSHSHNFYHIGGYPKSDDSLQHFLLHHRGYFYPQS